MRRGVTRNTHAQDFYLRQEAEVCNTMKRRNFLGLICSAGAWFCLPALALAQTNEPAGRARRQGQGGGRKRDDAAYDLPPDLSGFSLLSVVLGRVSDRSVAVSVLARESLEGLLEYGAAAGGDLRKTGATSFPAGQPVELILDALQPDTEYVYRLLLRRPGEGAFLSRPDSRFHTRRAAGSTFTFCVQGDSHPERPQMNDPELYARTRLAAAGCQPDFYVCMGDDFSVDTLREVSADAVAGRYALQRPFLGLVARSAGLVLVNGNHEQASLYNYQQADTRHDVAVWAQQARNKYFPTPAPDGFYSGDREPVSPVGALKDYYAWTWGDALFVVLDNYWHSAAQVDSGFQARDSGKKEHDGHADRDWWGMTLGDAQYRWFRQTLAQSQSKYKFVFAHHVMGTGRGGVEDCDLFEWGGRNRRGEWEFDRMRPGWELPVHQLMARHNVTIFFQGHDHLFARQERDGIVYQEVPNPADPGYVAYNQERYRTGVTLPNAGHLRVTVSAAQVKVDYVRSYLPKDEHGKQVNGEIAYSYTINPRASHA